MSFCSLSETHPWITSAMNPSHPQQANCVNFSSQPLNGSPRPDATSYQFWNIVHNEYLLHISIILVLFLFVFSLLVNTCVLLGLKNSEALSWQPRYMLFKNLIVSDLLQSLTLAPSVLYCLLSRQSLRLNFWCLSQFFSATLTIMVSLLTVLLMVLERFVYTCHGIHYLAIMTNVRIYICLSLIWLLAATVGVTRIVLVMLGGPKLYCNIPGFVCEPGVIQVHITFSVYFETFNKITMVSTLFLAILVFAFSYGQMYQEAMRAVQPFQQDAIRARRTVAFYLGIFMLQLFPCVFKFVTMFCDEENCHLLLVLLFLFPPCINPLAYGIRNVEVRQALARLCGVRRRVRQHSFMAPALEEPLNQSGSYSPQMVESSN